MKGFNTPLFRDLSVNGPSLASSLHWPQGLKAIGWRRAEHVEGLAFSLSILLNAPQYDSLLILHPIPK
jgi:hypothetical protein